MEQLFNDHVSELGELGLIDKGHSEIAERAEKASQELYLDEMTAYIKREHNIETHKKVLKKHGLLGLMVPKEYGGAGGDAFSLSLVFERLGQVGMGPVTFLDVQTCLTESPLVRWGNDDQKKKYLAPEAKGEKFMSFCLTEPEHGSDPASLQTQLKETKEGYVISGEKYLITNSSFADAFIVMARGKKGVSAVIVDRDEHVKVETEIKEKMGLFTSDTNLIKFDNAFAPKENLLGNEGEGLKVAYTGLLSGRLGIAAGCIGVMEDCLNAAVSRAKEREQFGKPIGHHQLVQKRIAAIEQLLMGARLSVDNAAYWKRKHDKDPADKALLAKADNRVTTAKILATDSASEAADNAVQLFGGFGYSILASPGRHYVDTRATRIYEGSNDVLELKIAADVLGREFEAYR